MKGDLSEARTGDLITLEDEGGIANVIVWIPTFERFRSIVLGARVVAVTGKLQNEAGVIHIVAERMEDLTPLLVRLSDDALNLHANMSTNETGRLPDGKSHPRSGDALVTALKNRPASAGTVMPKGRNFH